jgi:chaperone modulatory protein CbpM
MIDEREIVQMFECLEADALQRWVEQGWVRPQQNDDQFVFDDSDVARVQLICDLHYELRIEDDTLSVVLSLLDQLYTARRSLRLLVSAVGGEPEDVRARIARRMTADD